MSTFPILPIVDRYEPYAVGTVHPTGARELSENEVVAWIDHHVPNVPDSRCPLTAFAAGHHYNSHEGVRRLAWMLTDREIPDDNDTESVILFFLTIDQFRTMGIPWARLSENAEIVNALRHAEQGGHQNND